MKVTISSKWAAMLTQRTYRAHGLPGLLEPYRGGIPTQRDPRYPVSGDVTDAPRP